MCRRWNCYVVYFYRIWKENRVTIEVFQILNLKLCWLLGYYLITNDGDCSLINGSHAAECSNHMVSSEFQCRNSCSNHAFCVGYSYNVFNKENCTLYTSSNSCPNGFNLKEHNGFYANSSSQLAVGGDYFKYVCYGRANGKFH